MAITGSGTQESPYLVTTWDELLSVSTSDDVYINLPSNGGTFDMNDYYPEGITDTIILKGYINGNNWSIKNAYYRGGTACFDIGKSRKTKLHFLNCCGELTAGYFIGTNTSIPAGSIVFDQCLFSGAIWAIGSTTPYFTWIGRTAYFYRCSFNVYLEKTMLDYALYRLCNINAVITGVQGSGYIQLDNSYLSGSISQLKMQRYSSSYFVGDSVIDCEIDADITWDSGTPQHLLINSDKVASGVSIPAALTAVTSTQLVDASYLSSIGFPIQT